MLKNPDFRERPVSIDTFVDSPLYLNLKNSKGESMVRPRIREILRETFSSVGLLDNKYSEVVIEGGIGIGKDFYASVAISYMVYRLGCLKNPQEFFGFSTDSGIYVMFMSTSEEHAKNIIFSEVKARIDNSPWFLNRFAYDQKILSELRFPSHITIIPGNSAESFFEGYNIYGGVLDEADSHTRTPEKDFAEEGYYAIKKRIESRFGDKGLTIVIGSPKIVEGFLERRRKEGEKEKETYTALIPYWESPNPKTHTYSGQTFNFRGIKIPIEHKKNFDKDPERSLRDIAAIPSYAVEPFFAFPDRIEESANKERESPTILDKQFKEGFKAGDDIPRVIHIDLGINKKGGDACGICMGHITGYKEFEGEYFPKIKLDLLMQLTAPPQGEILISDVRQYVYELQRRKFNIKNVSYDGFASEESIQQLKRRGIDAELLSVDKDTAPYESLKEAIYQNRLDYYEHRKFIDEVKALEIINGEKVDHQPHGSKDVSDAAAGVVFKLSSNPPKYYRKIPKVLVGVPRRTRAIIRETRED